jgi:hypothetical protein
MLIHRVRVDIHRHIRRTAGRGRLARVTKLAQVIAEKHGVSRADIEAEIVSQALLEDVGLELGRARPPASY